MDPAADCGNAVDGLVFAGSLDCSLAMLVTSILARLFKVEFEYSLGSFDFLEYYLVAVYNVVWCAPSPHINSN